MQYTVKVCMLLAGCGRSRETRCFAGHADGHEKACAHTAFGNGQHPHVVFEKLWWQQVAMVEGQPVPLLSPHIVTAPSAGVSSAWTVIIVTHKVAKTADKYTRDSKWGCCWRGSKGGGHPWSRNSATPTHLLFGFIPFFFKFTGLDLDYSTTRTAQSIINHHRQISDFPRTAGPVTLPRLKDI